MYRDCICLHCPVHHSLVPEVRRPEHVQRGVGATYADQYRPLTRSKVYYYSWKPHTLLIIDISRILYLKSTFRKQKVKIILYLQ